MYRRTKHPYWTEGGRELSDEIKKQVWFFSLISSPISFRNLIEILSLILIGIPRGCILIGTLRGIWKHIDWHPTGYMECIYWLSSYGMKLTTYWLILLRNILIIRWWIPTGSIDNLSTETLRGCIVYILIVTLRGWDNDIWNPTLRRYIEDIDQY